MFTIHFKFCLQSPIKCINILLIASTKFISKKESFQMKSGRTQPAHCEISWVRRGWKWRRFENTKCCEIFWAEKNEERLAGRRKSRHLQWRPKRSQRVSEIWNDIKETPNLWPLLLSFFIGDRMMNPWLPVVVLYSLLQALFFADSKWAVFPGSQMEVQLWSSSFVIFWTKTRQKHLCYTIPHLLAPSRALIAIPTYPPRP